MLTPTPHPRRSQQFPFLDLPGELRNAVYKLCLVKGTIYPCPRPTYDHRYDNAKPYSKPEWALLAVSRQIRNEAADILLKQNHFVLGYHSGAGSLFWGPTFADTDAPGPVDDDDGPEDDDFINDEHEDLYQLTRRKVTSISITLDARGFATDLMDTVALSARFSSPNMEERDVIVKAHERFEDSYHMWDHLWAAFPRARLLQVDITNAYCPSDCHRYIDLAAKVLGSAIKDATVLEILEVVGTRNSAERAVIKEAVIAGGASNVYKGRRLRTLRFKQWTCRNLQCIRLHKEYHRNGLEDEEIDVRSLMDGGEACSITQDMSTS